ncbi:MAG: hypothetical protein IT220_04515 [Flavobacteriaceae bacterium]|nr:hypothetical protein [Flavobacteriaceae bacterium]
MKNVVFSLLATLLFMAVQAQESLLEIYPKYYGLSNDVKVMEEHNYTYNDIDKTVEKTGIVTITYDKGKLVSYKNQYLGEYPSESETVYSYDSKGLLIKKVYKDLTYNTESVYTYQYEKGKLKTELYESDYTKTTTKYEFDKKGKIIKTTTTDEDGNITSVSEYTDHGDSDDTYTLTYKYMVDGVASTTGISKYVNGKLVTYESQNEYFGNSNYTYQYDQNGNLISTSYDGDGTAIYNYEYVGSNFVKSYYHENGEYLTMEDFKFRKITFTNGKTIGSTVADMSFIETNNIVDEEEDWDFGLTTGCTGDCENGYGVLNYENGEQYEGFFKDGMRNGPGIIMYDDGSTFTGYWENDEKNGVGMYSGIEGAYYFGFHQASLRHGYGYEQQTVEGLTTINPGIWEEGSQIKTLGFADNFVTTGCVNGDCQDGFGKFMYDSGDVGIGYFKNGLMDKFGMVVYASGDIFFGDIIDNEFEGFGIYLWKNGSVYFGMYHKNLYEGLGSYIPTDDSAKLIGEFKAGSLFKSMLTE